MRKKILSSLALVGLVLALAPATQASEGYRQYVSPAGDAADLKGDSKGLKLFDQELKNTKRVKVHGVITAVSSTSITVEVEEDSQNSAVVDATTSYTFAITANTKILRRFRGSATVDELAIGHKVRIWADKLTDGTAKTIWDKSIWWLRLGGVVTTVNDDNQTFTFIIPRRNKEGLLRSYLVTVKTNASTVYLNEDGTAATFTDIDTSDVARVRGSWNNVSKFLLAKRVTLVPVEEL